jgi:GNAT superfamily N-acetyltransferase
MTRSTDLVPARRVLHRLRDGTEAMTRPITPGDAGDLRCFVAAMSDESNRRRFFTLHRRLSDAEVHRFTHVDHRDREAYVAMVMDEVVAIASYERESERSRAEVAFAVADPWHGLGLGTLLLQRLAAHARSEGVTVFTADVLTDNRPMIDVFEHAATATCSMDVGGVLHLEMPVASIHAPDVPPRSGPG